MRTIVHFGMSKAGSTALQKGLNRARGPLVERGILYPRAPIIGHSHNILMTGLMPPDDLPRFVRHSLDKARETPDLFDRWITALGTSLARSGAHTLVLSAENLWALRDAAAAARLRDMLLGLGATRIEAVAYLRRPSDWYLSMVGQILAASHRIKSAEPVPYRDSIEPIATCLADPGATRLRIYDRSRFAQGDILADFLAGTLDGTPLPPAPPREANVTLSAEGLDLLRGYRREMHRDSNSTFTRDTRRFLVALERAEAATPGHTRPALRERIARKLDHGAPDLLWLRDVHGLTFDRIDYDRIGTEIGTDGETWRKAFNHIDQLCPVDTERREHLMQRTFGEMATALEKAGKRKKKSGGTG